MIVVLFDFIYLRYVEGKNVFFCDYNIRRKTIVKVNYVLSLIMGMDMFFFEDFVFYLQKLIVVCLKNSLKILNIEVCVFK